LTSLHIHLPAVYGLDMRAEIFETRYALMLMGYLDPIKFVTQLADNHALRAAQIPIGFLSCFFLDFLFIFKTRSDYGQKSKREAISPFFSEK
jgi:hypothetical protein